MNAYGSRGYQQYLLPCHRGSFSLPHILVKKRTKSVAIATYRGARAIVQFEMSESLLKRIL